MYFFISLFMLYTKTGILAAEGACYPGLLSISSTEGGQRENSRVGRGKKTFVFALLFLHPRPCLSHCNIILDSSLFRQAALAPDSTLSWLIIFIHHGVLKSPVYLFPALLKPQAFIWLLSAPLCVQAHSIVPNSWGPMDFRSQFFCLQYFPERNIWSRVCHIFSMESSSPRDRTQVSLHISCTGSDPLPLSHLGKPKCSITSVKIICIIFTWQKYSSFYHPTYII